MTKAHPLKFGIIVLLSIVLTLGLSLSFQSLLVAWSPPAVLPPEGDNFRPIYATSSADQKIDFTTAGQDALSIGGDLVIGGMTEAVGTATFWDDLCLAQSDGSLNPTTDCITDWSDVAGDSLRSDCISDQILKWDGSSWECAVDSGGGGMEVFNGDYTGTGNLVTIATGILSADYPSAVAVLRGARQYDNDRDFHVEARESTGEWYVDIKSEAHGIDGDEASSQIFYSLVAFSDSSGGAGSGLPDDCDANEILKWDGSSWECASDGGGGSASTSMVDDWPDVVECNDGTGFELLYFMTKDDSGDYRYGAVGRNDATQLKYDSSGNYESFSNAGNIDGSSDCINKTINEKISEGRVYYLNGSIDSSEFRVWQNMGPDSLDDDQTHSSLCDSGYLMSGLRIYSGSFLDGFMTSHCTKSDFSLAGSTIKGPLGEVSDSFQSLYCDDNQIISSISVYATARFDHSLQLDCGDLVGASLDNANPVWASNIYGGDDNDEYGGEINSMYDDDTLIADCPYGHVAVGVRVYVNDFMENFDILCKKIN